MKCTIYLKIFISFWVVDKYFPAYNPKFDHVFIILIKFNANISTSSLKNRRKKVKPKTNFHNKSLLFIVQMRKAPDCVILTAVNIISQEWRWNWIEYYPNHIIYLAAGYFGKWAQNNVTDAVKRAVRASQQGLRLTAGTLTNQFFLKRGHCINNSHIETQYIKPRPRVYLVVTWCPRQKAMIFLPVSKTTWCSSGQIMRYLKSNHWFLIDF